MCVTNGTKEITFTVGKFLLIHNGYFESKNSGFHFVVSLPHCEHY